MAVFVFAKGNKNGSLALLMVYEFKFLTQHMKKAILILTVLCSTFIGCSKDGESNIVGTWRCEKITTRLIKDGVSNVTTEQREDGKELRIMVFRSDDTCVDKHPLAMVGGNGELSTVMYESLYKYSFDNDYLVLAGAVRYRVESMNSSEMVFVEKRTNDYPYYDSPEPVANYDEAYITYTMKKQ